MYNRSEWLTGLVDQANELENLDRILADPSAEPIQISYVAFKYITKNFAKEIGRAFGVVYLVRIVLDLPHKFSRHEDNFHVNAKRAC